MMQDIKLQMQCFALLGKTRKMLRSWLDSGEKSPGAVEAMRIRIDRLIADIDEWIDENDTDADI